MRETPRPQGTAGGAGPVHPQPRSGRASAHTAGVSDSGSPHRSDGRPPHTPRGARRPGHIGSPGTTPLVPGLPLHPRVARSLLGCLALILGLITWQVAADGPLRTLDERLGRSVARPGAVSSGDAPTTLVAVIAEFGADLGGVVVVLPVLALTMTGAVWCGRRARLRLWWLPPLAAALALGAVPALVAPLKALLGRPGPAGAPLGDGNGYYPSGHAATAAVGYGAALFLTVFARVVTGRGPRSEAPIDAGGAFPAEGAATVWRPVRRWALPALVCLNVAVGLGLVRRGYHWPLDVVGSWCLSTLLLSFVVWSVHRAIAISPAPPQAPPAGPQPPRAAPTPGSSGQ